MAGGKFSVELVEAKVLPFGRSRVETKAQKAEVQGGAAVALAAGVMAAQFLRPARTNPPFTPAQTIEAMIAVPHDLGVTLTRACADCHSNQTHWPWYSRVAPASWFVIEHVNHGRRFINLSAWVRPGHEPQDSIDRLKAMCREVQRGEMPLTSYKLVHWQAWLSADDANRICQWSETEQKRLSAPPR
jgi:hypothetical protein